VDLTTDLQLVPWLRMSGVILPLPLTLSWNVQGKLSRIFLPLCFVIRWEGKNFKIKIYRTIILPMVLYGCETWSLTLREERRLRVFENRVLRKVFGPKRDEVTGEWRKLHNEELNDLYSLPNIVRVVKSGRMRWAGHVARMGEDRGVHRVLVRKREGKRPLGRPRRRWEDNIKMDLQEVEVGRGNWMELAQDRDRWRAVVGTVRDFRVP